MVREFAEIASQSYQNLYVEIISNLPIFFDLILFRGIFEKEFYKFYLKNATFSTKVFRLK